MGEGKEVMTLGKGSKKQKESVFLARKCSKKSRNRKEKRKEKKSKETELIFHAMAGGGL